MTENVYQKAAAIWVARKFNLDADKITDVDFTRVSGGYCETCWYETLGVEFKYNGKYEERELGYYDTSPGAFIEEAVGILMEMGAELGS